MARGRPPKPAAVKALAGNPGKRGPKKPVDLAPTGEPPCPTNLCKVGKAEWRRIIPMLREMGLLAKTDAAVIGGYCEAFALWKRASTELNAADLVVFSSNGSPMANPLVNIKANSATQMHKFLGEIGLSPVARAKVIDAAASSKPAANPIDAAVQDRRTKQTKSTTGPFPFPAAG